MEFKRELLDTIILGGDIPIKKHLLNKGYLGYTVTTEFADGYIRNHLTRFMGDGIPNNEISLVTINNPTHTT